LSSARNAVPVGYTRTGYATLLIIQIHKGICVEIAATGLVRRSIILLTRQIAAVK
jgi:hypothetical protein